MFVPLAVATPFAGAVATATLVEGPPERASMTRLALDPYATDTGTSPVIGGAET
ncbi:hypothetical protein D3C86_2198480 [compost metagenome]